MENAIFKSNLLKVGNKISITKVLKLNFKTTISHVRGSFGVEVFIQL